MHTVKRTHEFCAGHRVAGHESKCKHLHGHNYRVHFYCKADKLDALGRVIDFSVIKERLCQWLEENWDHRFLFWEQDPIFSAAEFSYGHELDGLDEKLGCIFVPFNPTAENMAQYLVDIIGPQQLEGTGVRLSKVRIDETSKCSAIYAKKE